MADQPLSQTVVASRAETSWRSSIVSLLTSTAIEVLVLAALIVTPLVAAQTMPVPISKLPPPIYVPILDVTPPPGNVKIGNL